MDTHSGCKQAPAARGTRLRWSSSVSAPLSVPDGPDRDGGPGFDRYPVGSLPQSMRPLRSASTTAWVRSAAPSFAMSDWTPFFTVSSARTMTRAISLFVYPSAR